METVRTAVLNLPPGQRRALVDLLRDELDRGWIPRRADLEAALQVVRGGRREEGLPDSLHHYLT